MRGEVVVAAAGRGKSKHGENEDPADHAPGLALGAAKEKPEAGKYERECHRVHDLPQLIGEEIVCAAEANVAGVDAAHPGEADELVVALPPEVGRDDKHCERDADQNQGLRK